MNKADKIKWIAADAKISEAEATEMYEDHMRRVKFLSHFILLPDKLPEEQCKEGNKK